MSLKNKFVEAYDQSADGVFRYCYFRTHNREKAKDLTQEAFVRTWQSLAQGAPISNIKAYVYKTARNLIIDDSRKKQSESLDLMVEEYGFDPAQDDDQAGKLMNKIDGRLLLDSINKLDSQYREVVLMRYVEDLTPKEIADILQETPNAVSIKITRGLKALKQLLPE